MRRLASDKVQGEWARRVEAEYRSAAITQHLALWLLQIGASPDLVRRGLRIVTDELTHARMSFAVFRAAGGDRAPAIAREQLGLVRLEGEPLERDVVRACVRNFCLHETIAVPLFKALRTGCTAPSARRALDRVLIDEVRHRDFGWLLLGELIAAHAFAREQVERELPAMLVDLDASYASPSARADTAIDPADRAWGLMPGAEYAAIVARTVERDYVPRFRKLGIALR